MQANDASLRLEHAKNTGRVNNEVEAFAATINMDEPESMAYGLMVVRPLVATLASVEMMADRNLDAETALRAFALAQSTIATAVVSRMISPNNDKDKLDEALHVAHIMVTQEFSRHFRLSLLQAYGITPVEQDAPPTH